MPHVSRWHLYRNYIILIPLFVLVLVHQAVYIRTSLLDATKPRRVPIPPAVGEGRLISEVDTNAAAAGLHKGDRILAVNGVDFNCDRVFFEQLNATRPGKLLVFSVAGRPGSPAHTVAVAPKFENSAPDNFWQGLTLAILQLMLLICVLTGIYVAAVLPYDGRALIVFALLLSTTQLISTSGWWAVPQSFWAMSVVVRTVTVATWPLWLILFALHFPHRFKWSKRRPALEWIIISPLLAYAVLATVEGLKPYFSYDVLAWLPEISGRIVIALSISSFFPLIASKIESGTNSDSKRRLRLLLFGACVGLLPVGLYLAYQAIVPHGAFAPNSVALILIICILFLAFPLTLAYVVVAERAMNVRMVLRQGIRYTLVRGGARLGAGALVGFVMWRLSVLVFGSKMGTAASILVMVAAALLASRILSRLRTRLLTAVDRRFFREAYNAEKILEELSESVQLLAMENELLDTVSRRISETLHVPSVTVLLRQAGVYRPACCLGSALDPEVSLHEGSRTVDVVRTSRDPARVYFDRKDNWVHDVPEVELLTLKRIGAQLLLPVGAKHKLLGIVSLGPKLSEEPYSTGDIHLLKSVLAQTGLALENSRLMSAMADEVAQRERLNREVEIAREVQERLFPQRMPVLAGIEYSGACRPALGVGGDYYDFLQLANGELGIAIGDVSGKGIAAALLMASLQASLRGQAMVNHGNLAYLMANVNQLVFDATPINRYATFFYGQYNRETRVFTYVNAGHNPPFVLRHTRDSSIHVIRLETGGPVIGLFPNAPYQQGTLILEPGDIFVGYTDGISEAMNSAEEEWGEDRLIPAVASHDDRSASELIPYVMEQADLFVAGAPQHDDMTLVVMKMSHTA